MSSEIFQPDVISGAPIARSASLGTPLATPTASYIYEAVDEQSQQWVMSIDSSAWQAQYSLDTVWVSGRTVSASGTFDILSSQQGFPGHEPPRLSFKPQEWESMRLVYRSPSRPISVRLASSYLSDFSRGFGWLAPSEEHRGTKSDSRSTCIPPIWEIGAITALLFPGNCDWEKQSDPNDVNAELVVFTVTARGEWDDIRPAVLKWHERVEEICPDHFNHFGLRVFPE